MYGRTYYTRPTIGFGRPWTPMVRTLILINGGIFLADLVARGALGTPFALDTGHPLQLWRYVSYMFLHDTRNVFHILFNMFALWIFGSDLEEHFGSKNFLRYYFFTGIGAGICVLLVDLVLGQRSIVVGASGAVFGLLLAYGVIYAERTITMLLFFVLPVSLKAKHFVIIFGAVEFLFGVSGSRGVAHFAHLGGMAFGYLYLKTSLSRLPLPKLFSLQSLRDRFELTRRQSEDRRMDDLLRKVNEQGIQSLTEEEKQFLHKMSRRKKWN